MKEERLRGTDMHGIVTGVKMQRKTTKWKGHRKKRLAQSIKGKSCYMHTFAQKAPFTLRCVWARGLSPHSRIQTDQFYHKRGAQFPEDLLIEVSLHDPEHNMHRPLQMLCG